jgi:hypothetical protein
MDGGVIGGGKGRRPQTQSPSLHLEQEEETSPDPDPVKAWSLGNEDRTISSYRPGHPAAAIALAQLPLRSRRRCRRLPRRQRSTSVASNTLLA